MQILLLTLSDILPIIVTEILNPANEYCAIVVDEPNVTRKFLSQFDAPESKIYSYCELKECAESFYYDCLLNISDGRTAWSMYEYLKKNNVPTAKFFNVLLDNGKDNFFMLDRAMRYYREHAAEFEIFATGISHMEVGLDATQFKRKFFNFARGSQDMYYDYQLAKFVLSVSKNIHYALIGLTKHSFYYDESKAGTWRQRNLQYAIALNDTHNCLLSAEEAKKLFREDFLSMKLSLENFDVNDVFNVKYTNPKTRNFYERMDTRRVAEQRNKKNYPETRAENIKILDDYLTLCEKNFVRPIIFTCPMTEEYKKYFDRYKANEFEYLIWQAIKKHPSAAFLDGWNLEGFSDEYFYDYVHMNLKGAAKFSAILNQIVEQQEK